MDTWPNWVDLVIITLFLRGCYVGFSRGLLTEFLYGIGAVVITAFSINYYGLVVDQVRSGISMDLSMMNAAVFWLLFVLLFFITRMIIRWIAGVVKWERLHWFAEGLGLVLGAVRGIWWAGLIVVALAGSGFSYMQESVEGRSILGPRLVSVARSVLSEVSAQFPGAEYRSKELVPALKPVERTRRP